MGYDCDLTCHRGKGAFYRIGRSAGPCTPGSSPRIPTIEDIPHMGDGSS